MLAPSSPPLASVLDTTPPASQPLPSSDVEEGGETVFKKEGRHNADVVITDFKSCEAG